MVFSNNDKESDGIHSGFIQGKRNKCTQSSFDGAEVEKNKYTSQGMVVHTCNLNTYGTGAEVLQVQGQPGIQSKALFKQTVLSIVGFP